MNKTAGQIASPKLKHFFHKYVNKGLTMSPEDYKIFMTKVDPLVKKLMKGMSPGKKSHVTSMWNLAKASGTPRMIKRAGTIDNMIAEQNDRNAERRMTYVRGGVPYADALKQRVDVGAKTASVLAHAVHMAGKLPVDKGIGDPSPSPDKRMIGREKMEQIKKAGLLGKFLKSKSKPIAQLSTRAESAKALEAAYNAKSLAVSKQLQAKGISKTIAEGTGMIKVNAAANPKRAAETLLAFSSKQSDIGKVLVSNGKPALPELYKSLMATRKAQALLKKGALKGGLAEKEGKTKKDFDPKAIAQGAKVEAEHTSNKGLREEIAMDHLTEDPKYYDKLKKMEKKSGVSEDQTSGPTQAIFTGAGHMASSPFKSKLDKKVWEAVNHPCGCPTKTASVEKILKSVKKELVDPKFYSKTVLPIAATAVITKALTGREKTAGVGWDLHGYSVDPQTFEKTYAAVDAADKQYEAGFRKAMGEAPKWNTVRHGFLNLKSRRETTQEHFARPDVIAYMDKAKQYRKANPGPKEGSWEYSRRMRVATPFDRTTNYKLNINMDYGTGKGGSLDRFTSDLVYGDKPRIKNLTKQDLLTVKNEYAAKAESYAKANPKDPYIVPGSKAFLSKADALLKNPKAKFFRLEYE